MISVDRQSNSSERPPKRSSHRLLRGRLAFSVLLALGVTAVGVVNYVPTETSQTSNTPDYTPTPTSTKPSARAAHLNDPNYCALSTNNLTSQSQAPEVGCPTPTARIAYPVKTSTPEKILSVESTATPSLQPIPEPTPIDCGQFVSDDPFKEECYRMQGRV